MLHKEWKELIAYIESHPEAVRICRKQEEVDRAIGDQVAYLGLEDLSQGAISQENISQEESFGIASFCRMRLMWVSTVRVSPK